MQDGGQQIIGLSVMETSALIATIEAIRDGNIIDIFKGHITRIITTRDSHINDYDRYRGLNNDSSWLNTKVIMTCDMDTTIDIVVGMKPYQFEDIDSAYILYLIAEMRSIAFIEKKNSSILGGTVNNQQIELISVLDNFRELIHSEAEIGYRKYAQAIYDSKDSKAMINPMRRKTELEKVNLVYQPYADTIVSKLDTSSLDLMNGGW